MIFQNWMHTCSLPKKIPLCNPLSSNLNCECLVIGGGFAGLHAALALVNAGKKVVLLEKRICGGSSSGQSAGFLTPESEEDVIKLINRYGEEKAKMIYEIPLNGLNLILENIKKYGFECDLRKQDSLYLSIKKSHNSIIMDDAEIRKSQKLPFELLDEKGLEKVHPGKGYRIGIKYPGSYGINSFLYCQEMKLLLTKKGVKIFEDSEVHKIEGTKAFTHLGSVKAKNVIICIDKMKTEFNQDVSKKVFHVQTYLAVSEPLNEGEMKSLFPNGELMCWDTRWNYAHYRPITGNRILIGGSSNKNLYSSYVNNPAIISAFIDELKKRFPEIKDVHFTHYWNGLIDLTKDFVPIADYDSKDKSIQYSLGCAGLPWAAFCGDYLARRVVNPDNTVDLSGFLGMHRKFFVPEFMQNALGKKFAFGLSHLRELLR